MKKTWFSEQQIASIPRETEEGAPGPKVRHSVIGHEVPSVGRHGKLTPGQMASR
jgi:hypothetical protein